MDTEIKVSIPISFDLLKKIDDVAKEQKENTVELIERVMEDYAKLMRQRRDARDVEILNRIAEEQRDEILENLEYQVDIWNEENFIELKNNQNRTQEISRLCFSQSPQIYFVQLSNCRLRSRLH